MANPVIIGQPGPNQFGYLAGYQDQQIEVYAPTLYTAKQAAVAHFQPSKKTLGELWVVLAARVDLTPVVHTADN